MSIATRIQSINEHIEDAYDSLNKMGVTANDKNIENIAGLVDQIYENAPKTNYIEGADLILENTMKGQLKYENDIISYGSIEQITTTGINMLDLTDGTYTNNGITAVVNNGTIVLNGTASANSFLTIPIVLTLSENQSYTISVNNTDTLGRR